MIRRMETVSRASLPDDIDALKAMVLARDAALYSQSLLIEKLKLQLSTARRHRFGASSESLDQLELGIEDMEVARAGKETPAPDAELDEPKRRPKRLPLPNHLHREEIVHDPEPDCGHCGKPLRKLGEDVREILDFVPGRFVVRRHVRPKLSCRDCGIIAQAPMPSLPIVKGVAGPGLIAHVLVSKFADHLPLYRQAQIYAREGVELDRSTLAGWVGQSAALLDPLVEAIGRHVLAGAAIHTDDAPVPVLDPGRGATKTGRLWTYVRDERPHGSAAPPAAW
jgi:transposase